MARVRFTSHLKRFFPDLTNGELVAGNTVSEVVAALDARHPGLGSYVSDDRGENWRCIANNLPPVYSVRFA